MARLRAVCDSDEEFPDVSTILRRSGTDIPQAPTKVLTKDPGNKVPLGYNKSKNIVQVPAAYEDDSDLPKNITNVLCNKKQSSRQRPLGTALVNSLVRPITDGRLAKAKNPGSGTSTDSLNDGRQVRSSPRRTARQRINYRVFISEGTTSGSENESYFDDVSDFVVNDSASESELVATRSHRRNVPQTKGVPTPVSRRSHVIDDSTGDGDYSPLQKPEEDLQRPLGKSELLAEKPHLPVPFARNPWSEVIDLTSPAKAMPPIAYPDFLPKCQSTITEPGVSEDQNCDAAPAVLQLYVDNQSSVSGSTDNQKVFLQGPDHLTRSLTAHGPLRLHQVHQKLDCRLHQDEIISPHLLIALV